MYIVTEKDLIGDIEVFPIEVVQKMVERQFEQTGKCDVEVFQRKANSGIPSGEFEWSTTEEEYWFWNQVVHLKNFDLFFEKYPKQEEELPLPRKVLVWYSDEDYAVERELLHVFPESLNLKHRFIVRHVNYPTETASYRHMKELPTAKKMTKEEIEQELGYKIEIV